MESRDSLAKHLPLAGGVTRREVQELLGRHLPVGRLRQGRNDRYQQNIEGTAAINPPRYELSHEECSSEELPSAAHRHVQKYIAREPGNVAGPAVPRSSRHCTPVRPTGGGLPAAPRERDGSATECQHVGRRLGDTRGVGTGAATAARPQQPVRRDQRDVQTVHNAVAIRVAGNCERRPICSQWLAIRAISRPFTMPSPLVSPGTALPVRNVAEQTRPASSL